MSDTDASVSYPPSADELRTRIAELAPRRARTRFDRIEVVDETGSTNADLIARAAEPDLDGSVLLTTDQTAGRGRHARVWSAPRGGQVAVSAAVAVGDATARLGWLSLIAGLSATAAIENVTGVRPVLKWPNDVLVGDRKVAGILSEYATIPDGAGIAVLGIGINTNMTDADLPVDTATSLREVTGSPVDVAALVLAYLDELAGWAWPPDVDALAAAYRARCDTLGRRVRLTLPGDVVVDGTAADIDTDGRIVVDGDDGRPVVAAAADVLHLRPTEE